MQVGGMCIKTNIRLDMILYGAVFDWKVRNSPLILCTFYCHWFSLVQVFQRNTKQWSSQKTHNTVKTCIILLYYICMSSLSTYDKKVNVVFLYPCTICRIKLNQHCIVFILLTYRYWTRTIPECPTQRLESSMPDSTWMAAGTAAVWMLVNRTREWPWPILIMGIGRQFLVTKSGTWSLSGAH